jgi:class 3 adenylate cyclase
VLERGLAAWSDSGFPTRPIDGETPPRPGGAERRFGDTTPAATHRHTYLPGLVENYVHRYDLPIKRELALLFVDIADSTAAILGKTPEEALAYVQRFMGIVTETALAYCGDVKDYEGDGALLYFESVAEAAQAAFAIRAGLGYGSSDAAGRLRARLSLDVGDIVIGEIGTALRRSVALIGPSINRAARLLKQIPPDGIIATEAIVHRLRAEAPDLAGRFVLLAARLELKGFDRETVTAYTVSD